MFFATLSISKGGGPFLITQVKAPPLQYGIYQHLAHQELHAFYFYVYEKNLAGFVFHGRKKYMHASGIKSRDLYHIFDKLISNCSNRHR